MALAPTNSKHYNTITSCSLCENDLELVLPLAPTPPANEILPYPDNDKETYPLNLMKCKKCDHLQLDAEISMRRLFKYYVYTSNTSPGNLEYFHKYADYMKLRFQPSFVVDIGSNDGTFLHFFKSKDTKVLGVDPAENICRIAEENGIETECAFFDQMVANNIIADHGKADLITCNNMFAHNRNLAEVLLGVKDLLSDDGTFVFEVSYAMSMLEKNLFDLIYHEHFHHHHLLPLVKFIKKFGLRIYDATLIPETHGGSIRIYVEHNEKPYHENHKLKAIILNEAAHFTELLTTFKVEVPLIRDKVVSILKKCKEEGKQVSILGYPAKACTLSYYFDVGQYITKCYDENPLKIGNFTHNGMTIHAASDIVKDKPDYLLLLCWNYKEEILERFKFFRKGGGKFIVPLPVPEII